MAASSDTTAIAKSPIVRMERYSLGRMRNGVVRMFSAMFLNACYQDTPQKPTAPGDMHGKDCKRQAQDQVGFSLSKRGLDARKDHDGEIQEKYRCQKNPGEWHKYRKDSQADQTQNKQRGQRLPPAKRIRIAAQHTPFPKTITPVLADELQQSRS